MNYFTGKEFVVTGVGRGIGQATAERLVAEGGRVWCFDLAAERLGQAVAEMDGPGSAVGVVVDISDDRSVENGYRQVADTSGGVLHGLAHCAAIGRARAFEEMTWADWEVELKVNLYGTYLMTREAAPLMRAARGRPGAVEPIAPPSPRHPCQSQGPWRVL